MTDETIKPGMSDADILMAANRADMLMVIGDDSFRRHVSAILDASETGFESAKFVVGMTPPMPGFGSRFHRFADHMLSWVISEAAKVIARHGILGRHSHFDLVQGITDFGGGDRPSRPLIRPVFIWTLFAASAIAAVFWWFAWPHRAPSPDAQSVGPEKSAYDAHIGFWGNDVMVGFLEKLIWPVVVLVIAFLAFILARQAMTSGHTVEMKWKVAAVAEGRMVLRKTVARTLKKPTSS